MTINDNQQLKTEISTNESRAHWSAWLIVGGLVTEIVLAFVFPEGRSLVQLWAPVIATAFIALGVYGEIHFGRKVGEGLKTLQAATEDRLTEALTRASEAQEKLVKYLTPRRALVRPKIESAASALSKFAGTKFDMGCGEGDGEQADCLWDLEEVLAKANWSQLAWGVSGVGVAVIMRGGNPRPPLVGSVAAQNVEIHLNSAWEQKLRPAALALVSALDDLEVVAQIVPNNCHSANVEAMHILIGPKR